MKKKLFAYMLALTAIVSVTSGCMVREGYGNRRYHHDRYYNNGYDNGYNRGDHHDRGY
ncbi:hypothetical protein G7092_29300 [Mucilaginibacter sp. HC2]|jgi:hypothetical protein|uniref:hypothetical protein n=1 Tax=Mucilaginibacter inviolabilis TaxID=2714892 RepID=UPI00140B4F4A|nr:hypothetical protein [Mucilaginibacter inviolabilis]NHA07932.1 hypothetical protein [Mucilaginibacter inviolabilis]